MHASGSYQRVELRSGVSYKNVILIDHFNGLFCYMRVVSFNYSLSGQLLVVLLWL